jgi:hypothetical protein
MQRNLSRIQRNDLIARNTGGASVAPAKSTTTGRPQIRGRAANTAGYGYGERSDMVKFLADGKKVNFDNLPTTPVVKETVKEAKIGEWEVTQIIRQNKNEGEVDEDEVKKEESPESAGETTFADAAKETEKRRRGKTPDPENLFQFRVQEKTFPIDVKEEGEEAKVPSIGFKKRKLGGKSSRMETGL